MNDFSKIDFEKVYDSLSPEEQRAAGIVGLRWSARIMLTLTFEVKQFISSHSSSAIKNKPV